MEGSPLKDIFEECPRFRILASGKSGVGKTTLIKEAFNIDNLQSSHKDPGQCDIEDELSSDENIRFVLHDSQGFEAGETENFNRVKNFITSRKEMPQVKDRLHAVWLCILVPGTGGRLIEAGDEEFLKLPFGDIPVVIVFTQYDRMCDQISYDLASAGKLKGLKDPERSKRIEQEAEKHFRDNCVRQLESFGKSKPRRLEWVMVSNKQKYRHTLHTLIETTEKLVRNHVQESVWVVSAIAQRVNADQNVETCIAVGMKKYWRGLAAGTYFADRRLDACISSIHQEMVSIWNFKDEDKILPQNFLKEKALLLVQDLADPSGSATESTFTQNLEAIKAAVDVVTPLSGPAAPIVATVGLSVMFVRWLDNAYKSTPGILRCLMGYIVDLTIVLEILFWLKIAQPNHPSVCEEDIIAAFNMYHGTTGHREVHQKIRKYVDDMSLLDQLHPEDNTHLEVEQLIRTHRRVLIQDLVSLPTQPPPTPTKPQQSPKPQADQPTVVAPLQSPKSFTPEPKDSQPSLPATQSSTKQSEGKRSIFSWRPRLKFLKKGT